MTAAAESPSVKEALRRHYRSRRRGSLAAVQTALRQVALREVPPLVSPHLRLGLYWPLAGEPDLDPFAAGGLAGMLGERLALPAVLPSARGATPGSLVYLPWERDSPLLPDACGIPAPALQSQPPPLQPEALGLLLVPALAIDPDGIRLGSGGGWYDRLRADPRWRAVPAVAVVPAACRSQELPRDPWDVPFDGWLDETGLSWIRRDLPPGRLGMA
jgi:5-formyltetrahydrofolate cyclo-ligase